MANGNDKNKKSKKYKVKEGDSLSKLAEEYGMSVEDILKLNPQYKDNPDLIIPGEEIQLTMGNLDSVKNTLNTFVDSAKDILKGDKKLEDTKLGQFFGKGKEFKDTKLGTALGGGKPFEETGVGQLLGGGKPFKDTKVGDFITSKEPLIGETPLIFKPKVKRGGGLIHKYDNGGIFGDVASFFSDFKESGAGEYLMSDEGKEDIAGVKSFAGDMQNMGKAKQGETKEQYLNRMAEGPDAGDAFDTVVGLGEAGVDLASGNIPGAVINLGKTLFESFSKKKQRKGARRELKKIEDAEDIMVDNPMGSDFSTEVLAQEQPVDVPEEGLMYSMARGGMISPDVMPFLSDSYKRYLSTQYMAGGNVRTRVPSINKRRPEFLKYELKNGGMVKGPSHEKGGVKFNVGGEVVELEGGEAVINKKSTEMFRPILSKMNQAGGGVSFARGGIVNPNVQKMVNRLMRKSR